MSMDKRLFFLLILARHKLLKTADNRLSADLGVSTTQIGALFFLHKHDGCRLSALSEGLALNNSAITGLVSRMERSRLIEKRRCEDDGRSQRVFMTDKGREIAEKGFPALRKFNRELTEGFSREEVDVVLRFLNTVVHRYS